MIIKSRIFSSYFALFKIINKWDYFKWNLINVIAMDNCAVFISFLIEGARAIFSKWNVAKNKYDF